MRIWKTNYLLIKVYNTNLFTHIRFEYSVNIFAKKLHLKCKFFFLHLQRVLFYTYIIGRFRTLECVEIQHNMCIFLHLFFAVKNKQEWSSMILRDSRLRPSKILLFQVLMRKISNNF